MNKNDKHLDFFPIIQKFIVQAKTDNLQKKGGPTTYLDLDFKVSFGIGNSAKVPWITFLKSPNTVSDGIYPVYLYYKAENLLILAYGVSETDTPNHVWPEQAKYETVKHWFKKMKIMSPLDTVLHLLSRFII
ncbi:MAG: hypothetical protein JWP12_1414 [Bacteroidetes bacterium]|nr:hypothetical protein [Bacteroidota bacterium]